MQVLLGYQLSNRCLPNGLLSHIDDGIEISLLASVLVERGRVCSYPSVFPDLACGKTATPKH